MSPRAPSPHPDHPATAPWWKPKGWNVTALTLAFLATCATTFHGRMEAAIKPSAADTPSSPQRPTSPRHRITRTSSAPSEDPAPCDPPAAVPHRSISYADPAEEALARLQECGRQCQATPGTSRFDRPFWHFPNYLMHGYGLTPWSYYAPNERSITCVLPEFDSFETYIAVNPWDAQLDISHRPEDFPFFPTRPFPSDPCEELAIYEENLYADADSSVDEAGDLLEEEDFEWSEEEAGHEDECCFYRYEELVTVTMDMDTGVLDTGFVEWREDEDAVDVYTVEYVVCVSELALSGSTTLWENGERIYATEFSVEHPNELPEAVDEELDVITEESNEIAKEF